MSKGLRFSLASALLLAGAPSLAQGEDEEIVVTGRGLPRALGDEAYDEVVIPRERLTGSASNRLEEILREVPGFQLFRRSDARSANPTTQGATLRALGGNASSRALLVLDGVPQTDPFGGWISWPAFDPRRLGLVRVLRGGGSGVHGPGALAGTIELTSAAPSELGGAGGEIAYGSRHGVDAFASMGMKSGGAFLSASGSLARGAGFVPVVEEQRGAADRPSPYTQAAAQARAVAPIGDDLEVQASGLWFSDERERGTRLSDIRTTGADASLRVLSRGRWRWSALGYVQTRDFYNSFASASGDRSSVQRTAEQHSVPSTGLGAAAELRPPVGREVELRLGGDWRSVEGRTREQFAFVNGAGTRSRVAGGSSATFGAFAEAAHRTDRWTLTGGVRLDHWRIEDGFLSERELATGASLTDLQFPDRTGWEPTGRGGIAFRISQSVTLRAAGYIGWRLPTLNELYRPFRVGPDATGANAALAPERLKGAELGLRYGRSGPFRAELTLFRNRLENAIGNATLGRGPGVFPGAGFVPAGGEYRQRRNFEAIEATGVETQLSLDLGAWSASAGHAFVDAEVEAGGPALPLDGLRPAQTPRHTLSASLSWRSDGGARASLGARYTGSQFEDDLNRQRIPDAILVDFSASIPIAPGLSLNARAENVTGERVVAAISGTGTLERTTPRTLWIGIRLR